MNKHDQNWENIVGKAESKDIFDRLASLTRSVFYFELALVAIGTVRNKHEGLMSLLNKSILPKRLEEQKIKNIHEIIYARNNAVHEGKIPSPKKCSEMVKNLLEIWVWMRQIFVTKQTAASLSSEILKSDIFYNAFLFGSLARNNPQPGDIDLLLFDNGEISLIGDRYGELRYLKHRTILEKAGIENKIYYAALDLDWLDIVVVHHVHFVKNPDYIRNIASAQSPYFLLNIADGIKEYDKKSNHWIDCNHLPFEKWQSIRKQLEKEGIVSKQ